MNKKTFLMFMLLIVIHACMYVNRTTCTRVSCASMIHFADSLTAKIFSLMTYHSGVANQKSLADKNPSGF